MEVQDKIDAYVKNEMPPDERAAFEAELLQDTALQEAVQQARLDLDVANRLIETEILGWMQDWEPESATADAGANRSPLRVSASNVRKYWMAAAAALALVAAAVWFFIRPEHTRVARHCAARSKTCRPRARPRGGGRYERNHPNA
jgi:anti-sigma factor RsiW